MPAYKCRMCGADLEVNEGDSVVECSYCRSTQAVPSVDDEKLLKLFARANKLLRACEFDKAAGLYEQIVAEDDASAEAYWGLFLCRYGIEYVDEPAGGKKPTLHRASFENVMDDEDLELACENADPTARRLYRDQAKEIERIRRRITEVSGAEEPYDIFICYKETDPATGERTLDSVLAQDIYKALENEGYRAFFSRVTLEGKLGLDYEPYIFAALNSAKVMLVIGTNYDHFDAVWVKNEWSRFLRLMEKGSTKHLIPCYKGIDAYDMPSEFARLQGQDMGKVGAIQDLLHGVEKLLGGKAGKKGAQSQAQRTVSSGPQNEALLERARMALEDGEWGRVNEFCEQVLNNDPRCAQAYLYKLMSATRHKSVDSLAEEEFAFDDPKRERRLEFASGEYRERLEDIIKIYPRLLSFADDELKKKLEGINEAIRERKRKKIEEIDLHWAYKEAEKKHKTAVTREEYADASKAYKALGDYNDATTMAQVCIDEWASIEKRAKAICDWYVSPVKLRDNSASPEERVSVLETLKRGFADAKDVHDDAEKNIALISEKKSDLKAERASLGIFPSARKREVSEKLKQLAKEEGKWEKARNAALAKMGGYENENQLDAEITAAKRDAKAVLERENNQALLKKAIDDPKALLYAENLKKGILNSMADDPEIWPLIKSTTYLLLKTAKLRKVLRSEELKMGKWHGVELTWRMIKEEKGAALLLCSACVAQEQKYGWLRRDITWAECSLRTYLNGSFLEDGFSALEQESIVAVNVKNSDNKLYGISGGEDTTDRVFCLSIDEVQKLLSYGDMKCKQYVHAGLNPALRQSGYNLGQRWWLRSPGNEQCKAAYVNGEGRVVVQGMSVDGEDGGHYLNQPFVRPAFWLRLETE